MRWCPAMLQNCTWPVPRTNGSYDGTHGTPRDDRCNPGKGGVHWFGLCGWRFFASRNVWSPCSLNDSDAGRGFYFWSSDKLVENQNHIQVPSSTSSSTVQVADGHVEVVDAFVYLECMIDSSGGSRGEVLCRIGLARRRVVEAPKDTQSLQFPIQTKSLSVLSPELSCCCRWSVN